MSQPDSRPHPKDPLHGITLETIVTRMVERHGWAELGKRIPVRCFHFEPSIKSSLTFLRKTPWARKRLEDWYVFELEAESPRLHETPPEPPL